MGDSIIAVARTGCGSVRRTVCHGQVCGCACRMSVIDLSSSEARGRALTSLGCSGRTPARAGSAHVRATAARLSAIQIDSVNVLARAHYLPTFSRYGPYPMPALDGLVHGTRELFEYSGHAACFLPIELYPLMRWRMDNQLHAWAESSTKPMRLYGAV